MKRYTDAGELKLLFFTAYFLYSRSKYGRHEHADVHLGRIGACRGVMQLCRIAAESSEPCPREQLLEAFGRLEAEGEALVENSFKSAYFETLELLRQLIS